ncbi:ribosomal L7Ae/L30e/S12e/Gadd45 family protein [archaeon]|nr:ribosomal L7Ae/L30e/S12e/Gadd45 family protein [archaeon]
MTIDNLKKATKEKKLIIGTERTIKKLKTTTVKEVFISKNCPPALKKEVKKYGEIAGIQITELKETNEEIGAICKKPFSINLCCY